MSSLLSLLSIASIYLPTDIKIAVAAEEVGERRERIVLKLQIFKKKYIYSMCG
jgi:hypothetical protein